MWTEITRAQYRRDVPGYASDTQAAEWDQMQKNAQEFRAYLS